MKSSVKSTKPHTIGASALARELGIDKSTVFRKLAAGVPVSQIRTDAAKAKLTGNWGKGSRMYADPEKKTRRDGYARTATTAVGKPAKGKKVDAKVERTERTERTRLPGGYIAARGSVSTGIGTGAATGRTDRVGTTQSTPLKRAIAAVADPDDRDHDLDLDDFDAGVDVTDADADAATYQEARRRKEWAIARKHELELRQLSGDMVTLRVVNAFFAQHIKRAQDMLLRIGPELRDRLAAEDDPVRCEKLVDDAVRSALNTLSLMDGTEAGARPTSDS